MSAFANNRRRARNRSTKIDLYDYCRLPEPKPRGRPVADDLSDWRVIDDWPDEVPMTPDEVDVFEAWFGDILEELFAPEDSVRD
ncbi:hypothetical protein [Palleronia rufa]|uniref:hypothetical protein n=1 Tax=Palleronia rufa TaxID=1530186 RepID=UPI0005663444|nr:hypothetical protein [Palleronia rufa]